MQVKFTTEAKGDAQVWFAHEGAERAEFDAMAGDAALAAFAKAAAASRFRGAAGQILELLAPAFSDADRVLVVGLGKRDSISDAAWEKAAGGVVKRLLTSGAREVCFIGAPDAKAAAHAALGARLAAYRFDAYRTTQKPERKPSLEKVWVVATPVNAADKAYAPLAARAEGVELARTLMNEPPNVLHPESYAVRIAELASLGLEVEVLDEPAMAALGMNALLGVGQGSIRGSRLCVIKWMGGKKSEAPLALVGKGVTFDTGGISLKPGAGMEEMKGDMGGSAAVVGTLVALAKRKAKANVVGLVGLVENMPDGQAQRPGDIVTSASGKTIEIQNTDAEGRLVLCDVLWYAQKHFNPKAVIDLATLTGAIIISLGNEHAGLFSNDDALSEKIAAAGKAEGESVWRLPMGPGYDKQIDSDFADMKNIGGGKGAGSITAAQFLARFIDEGRPWAHIDIAGTAWKSGNDNPLEPGWATGYGVRLLDRLVKDGFEG